MVNKGSSFADFVRFRPHTYAPTELSLRLLWAAINPKINEFLLGTKSLCYFCVLHIVSNFIFTILLIPGIIKVRIYGFMLYLLIETGRILIFKHEFTVYYSS